MTTFSAALERTDDAFNVFGTRGSDREDTSLELPSDPTVELANLRDQFMFLNAVSAHVQEELREYIEHDLSERAEQLLAQVTDWICQEYVDYDTVFEFDIDELHAAIGVSCAHLRTQVPQIQDLAVLADDRELMREYGCRPSEFRQIIGAVAGTVQTVADGGGPHSFPEDFTGPLLARYESGEL